MLSVASCSSSQPLRKRKNDSDHESSEIKVRREDVYIVLESESDVSSSDDGTESILSLQNKSTDFARDTSDTSSKTSRRISDLESLAGIEYEVVSLSEQEAPFTSCSSGTDSGQVGWRESMQSAGDAESAGIWADGSSAPTESDLDRGLIPLRLRNCVKCKAQTNVFQYCHRCFKIKKDFFPPRPKPCRKKALDKSKPKTSEVERAQAVSSWVESSSSQELLMPDTHVEGYEGSGLCNVCFKSPKNGAFLHNRWVHIYACYQCSLKIWFSTKCCPLCNGKIRQVLKAAFG